MTRRLAVLLPALVAGVVLTADPVQTAPGDLWIAVIGTDRLSPIAALIDGQWWFDKGPNNWAAPRAPAPTRWRAYPLHGSSQWVATTSLYEEPGEDDPLLGSRQLRIHTAMPKAPEPIPSVGATGVAIHGSVRVGAFTELPEAEYSRVLEWVRPYLAETDMDALRHAHAPYRDLATSAVAAMPFRVEEVVSSQGWDGARYYVLQGDRALESAKPGESCTTHVRVAIRRRPGGEQRLLAAWGDFDCGGLQLFETPIAWIERQGHVCWVMRLGFEDGVEYDVTTPALLGRRTDPPTDEDETHQATCSID